MAQKCDYYEWEKGSAGSVGDGSGAVLKDHAHCYGEPSPCAAYYIGEYCKLKPKDTVFDIGSGLSIFKRI